MVKINTLYCNTLIIIKNMDIYISTSDLVDEIIIVDTGSTDSSKKYQKIFAYNRNESIKKATCDWISVLDCDEGLIM